ncbi:MAG: hypothetical protein C0436_04355 [Alphaproteobacteria bacterium]|nr:hypothetical protein [Alphaproteobacteria bacterium]
MKKALKILFGGIAMVIVLLIAAPFFISADTYKSLLTTQVKKITGRTLLIAGDASLTLFPNVALNVENVSLSNPEGFADKDLTTIGKLKVDLALMPLLDKRIEMQGATLENAVISLEERADGTKSWEMMPAVKGTETTAAPAEKKAKNDVSKIVLGSVSIKDSKVIYRKAGEKPVVLENINVDIDSAGFDQNLDASVEALYNGGKVAAKANVKNPANFLAGTPTEVDMSATLPEASVAFRGTAAMADTLLAKGTFDASVKDVPALTKWATGKASGGVKAVAAKGTLSASGKTYAITDASFKADSIDATGDMAANLEGKVPSIKGNIVLGSLSLDAFSSSSATPAKTSNETKPTATASGWSTAAIDLSGLRAANADISISASDITSGKVKLGTTSFRIKLNDGTLNVKDIATSLYGGTASGDVRADASGAVGADLAAKGIQIEPLMTALSGKSRLAGTTNLTLNVNGSGKSQKAIVSSLGGKASLRVEDGAILGINIGKFLRDAKEGFLFSSNSSERTDFAELTANFAIASGIVSNNDLNMKAPLLRLGGNGTVSLPPKTIDYTLMPKIAATSQGQGGKEDKAGIAIPLRITGPWSNPSITPDLASALQENLKNPEAIKENVKAISESVKDLNSKDDLKRALGDSLNKKLGGSEGTTGSGKPDLGNILKGF